MEEIRTTFEASKRRYGAPRVHAELRNRGHRLSKRMVAKLMTSRRDGREASNGMRRPRRKRTAPITTDSRHSQAIAPNLLERNVEAVAPDVVWLAFPGRSPLRPALASSRCPASGDPVRPCR
ncbi:IS3 family transposase [Paralimibaculum aggregatum]|uniref:IS3 family transposase n=1 Tax=Paralimibaculum aggregatum TaxID=3036245 RepID=UPI0025548D71|nr:IS3 family transposase [Limibaculum sp. NKW23]